MTLDMLPWIVVRATGFAAFGLIATAMIAGLLVRTRGNVGPIRGAGMVGLHRHLSLLALLAIAVHAGALLFDHTLDIAPIALVVPGLIPHEPFWTGAGVVAAELALLVHLSFHVRRHIGGHNWRRLHWITYSVFVLGGLHGVMSGTDSATTWAIVVYSGAFSAVLGLTIWRATNFRRPAADPKPPAPARAVVRPESEVTA